MQLRLSLALAVAICPSLLAQTYVREHDQVVRPGPGASASLAALAPGSGPTASITGPGVSPNASCATIPLALQGMVVPGAGTLSPASFMNPALMNRSGAISFCAHTTDPLRNQGIFVVDATGLHAIAIGSGGGGGSASPGSSGDPTPLGGTFSGFFGGTMFAPAINDRGDVLFLADVENGIAPRGLFLYLADVASIVPVAWAGGPSPLGGNFTAVGPGVLNDYREVLFLGMQNSQYESDVFHYQNGAVTTFAAVGQAAPGGGVFQQLGTESLGMVDGTTIPVGPLPSINACGQVAFRAVVQGPQTTIGIVVRTNGVDQWYLRSGDPTPIGGTYASFQGAAINGRGEIAVFSDYWGTAGITSGWFAGAPGDFREVLSFYSPVDGGQCLGLAFSRNPMTTIDDRGSVVLWCDLGGNQGRIVVVDREGEIEVLARQGGPTGTGGTYGTIDAWPSLNGAGRATIDAGVIQGGVSSPYFAAAMCGPLLAASPCAPPGGGTRLDNVGPASDAFVVFAALSETNVPLPPYGTLEIGPSPIVMLYGPLLYPGTTGPHTALLPLPNVPSLVGASLHFQTLRLTANQLLLANSARSTLR